MTLLRRRRGFAALLLFALLGGAALEYALLVAWSAGVFAPRAAPHLSASRPSELDLLAALPAPVCRAPFAPAEEPAQAACCAKKRVEVSLEAILAKARQLAAAAADAHACSCPLCGDHCPGGAQCRCDHGAAPTSTLPGISLLVAPGCHHDAAGQAIILPVSLSFAFLPPNEGESARAPMRAERLRLLRPLPAASWMALPPEPPPDRRMPVLNNDFEPRPIQSLA